MDIKALCASLAGSRYQDYQLLYYFSKIYEILDFSNALDRLEKKREENKKSKKVMK